MNILANILILLAVAVFVIGMIKPQKLHLTRIKATLIAFTLFFGCLLSLPSMPPTSATQNEVTRTASRTEDVKPPTSKPNKEERLPAIIYATKPENAQLYKQFDGVWENPARPEVKIKFTEKDMDAVGLMNTVFLQYVKFTNKCPSEKVQYATIGDGAMQSVDAYFLKISNGYEGMAYLSRTCEVGEPRGIINLLRTPEIIHSYAFSNAIELGSDVEVLVKSGANLSGRSLEVGRPATKLIENK